MVGTKRLNPLLQVGKFPPLCSFHTGKLRGLASLAREGWYGRPHPKLLVWTVLSFSGPRGEGEGEFAVELLQLAWVSALEI